MFWAKASPPASRRTAMPDATERPTGAPLTAVALHHHQFSMARYSSNIDAFVKSLAN
ncbi:MAG: hypothetical protein R2857_14525 [Vampirovibrionales bacterium]